MSESTQLLTVQMPKSYIMHCFHCCGGPQRSYKNHSSSNDETSHPVSCDTVNLV